MTDERTPQEIEEAKARMAKVRQVAIENRMLERQAKQDRLQVLEQREKDREAEAKWVGGSSNLGGLSATDCPHDCEKERCVITGRNLCGHPFKSGLQYIDKMNPEVNERYKQAQKMLAHKRVDAL